MKNLRSVLKVLPAFYLLMPMQNVYAQNNSLSVATFTENGDLVRPDVTRWVFMGTNLGLGYAAGEFRNDRPGTFQIVHMEPTAYDYFIQNGVFADGTLFSLSFYGVENKSQPELNGFGQAELEQFEIHLLDKEGFEEEQAFYFFISGAETAPVVPVGSECVECHNEHAAYDGIFTQFYPPVRHLVPGN